MPHASQHIIALTRLRWQLYRKNWGASELVNLIWTAFLVTGGMVVAAWAGIWLYWVGRALASGEITWPFASMLVPVLLTGLFAVFWLTGLFYRTIRNDLIDPRNPVLQTMSEVRDRFGGSVLCLMRVPRESISLYGCPAVVPTDDDQVVTVTDLIEKPDVDAAPSEYAVIGRYLLDPAVFDVLRATPPGRGGEIQLTDALRVLASMPASAGGGVHGLIFDGLRYDTGDRLSYLQASVMLACEREDLGPAFRAWLAEFVAGS